MRNYICILSLLALVTGCYCPCRIYSKNLVPGYSSTIYGQRSYLQSRETYDYDQDYIPPYAMPNYDYMPITPDYYRRVAPLDEINDYPVSR